MKILSPTFRIILLFTISLTTIQYTQILSSVDFTKNVEVLASPNSNMIGISMYLPEVLDYLTSPIFLTRVNASKFNGNWNHLFYQSIHVGLGYKYNCTSSIYGSAVTCIKDLILNGTSTAMKKYINENTFFYAIDLGWDMEKSSFTTNAYFNNFKAYMNIFYSDSINLQLLDEGDRMLQTYNRTYTVTNFQSDITTIRNKYSGLYVNGPGITQNANTTWVARLPVICNSYYSTFTFKSILFKNASQATIQNLMSDYYSKGYLQRRLVNEVGAVITISNYFVGISQIKQISGSGISGVTNTFASALWALDITMEFAVMKGFFINFYNPLSASNQSFFGPGPLFEPAPMYYGVLFAIWALRNQPYIQRVPIIAGSSSNIKVYGLDDYYQTYRVLILNKDTNPNASGIVRVKLNSTYGMRCSYLSAPSLASTTDTTFAGLSFKANSTEMTGSFAFYDFKSSTDGLFEIVVNYSQAALCYPIQEQTYPNKLVRGDPRSMFNPQILISLLLLIIMISI